MWTSFTDSSVNIQMKKSIAKSFAVIATASLLFSSCASRNVDKYYAYPKITLWGIPAYEKVTVITDVATYKDVSMPVKVAIPNTMYQNRRIYTVISSNGNEFTETCNIKAAQFTFGAPFGRYSTYELMRCGKPESEDGPYMYEAKIYVDPSSLGIERPDTIESIETKAMEIDALFEPQRYAK